MRTYIGTQSGAYRAEGDQLVPLGLDGHTCSAIYAFNPTSADGPENDTILVGTYNHGMFRSTDGGATWTPANQGLTTQTLRTIIADPAQADALLCGTEPGRGFRSTDRGQSWQEMTGIAALPGSDEWFLPYSPRAGALRNFYAPPGHPDRLYASIEVGGTLRSDNSGATWTLLDLYASGIMDDDIHHVTGHPNRPDEVWLALGWATLRNRSGVDRAELGGVARSDDGGQTWTKMLDGDYTRAVIVTPSNRCWRPRRSRSADKAASSSPPMAVKRGNRRATASRNRCRTWSNSLWPRPTIRYGRSAPGVVYCAPNPASGIGSPPLPPPMPPTSASSP